MKWMSPERLKFARANNMECYWCGLKVDLKLPPEHPNAPTKEHITPKALKKNGEISDKVLAHKSCNERRALMEAAAFKRLMNGLAVTKYELWPHVFEKKENHV